MRQIRTELLTQAQFAPFGDVLDATGAPDRLINQGFCGRFHDRARLDFGPEGRAGLHHAAYDFNDEAAPVGASFFARLVERAQPLA